MVDGNTKALSLILAVHMLKEPAVAYPYPHEVNQHSTEDTTTAILVQVHAIVTEKSACCLQYWLRLVCGLR